MFYVIGSVLLIGLGTSFAVFLINKGYKDYLIALLIGYAVSSYFLPAMVLYNKINYIEKHNIELMQYLKEKDKLLHELHVEKETVVQQNLTLEQQLMNIEEQQNKKNSK